MKKISSNLYESSGITGSGSAFAKHFVDGARIGDCLVCEIARIYAAVQCKKSNKSSFIPQILSLSFNNRSHSSKGS